MSHVFLLIESNIYNLHIALTTTVKSELLTIR